MIFIMNEIMNKVGIVLISLVMISCQQGDILYTLSEGGSACLEEQILPEGMNPTRDTIGLSSREIADIIIENWELENIICSEREYIGGGRDPYLLSIQYTSECRSGGYAIIDGHNGCRMDVGNPQNWGRGILMHEVGHCLGLSHPSKVLDFPGRRGPIQQGKHAYFNANHPAWNQAWEGNIDNGTTGSNAKRPVMDGLLLGNYKPTQWELDAVKAIWIDRDLSTDTLERHNRIKRFLLQAILKDESDDIINVAADELYKPQYQMINSIALGDGLVNNWGATGIKGCEIDELFYTDPNTCHSIRNSRSRANALAQVRARGEETITNEQIRFRWQENEKCILLKIGRNIFFENGGIFE